MKVLPDRFLAFALLACSPFLASACGSGEAEANNTGGLSGKLVMTGSSTCAPAVTELAQAFEKLHPGVRIDVQTGGSSRGIRDASSGLADIGMSSRNLKPEEKEVVQSVTFAQDGVAFLIHAKNPVDEISDEDLKAIFTGEIDNWSKVGGQDAPITVINRAEGRSELSLVSKYFGIETDQYAADVIAGENQQGIKQVASDENAIVYMSVGTSEFEKADGTPIKILPLRGIDASSATVAAGSYPLARPLIFVTQPNPSELQTSFMDYCCSKEAQPVLLDHSFVPTSN